MSVPRSSHPSYTEPNRDIGKPHDGVRSYRTLRFGPEVTAVRLPLVLALHDYPPATGGGLALAARDLSQLLEHRCRSVVLSSRLRDHFADDRQCPGISCSSSLGVFHPTRLRSLLRSADLLIAHWTFSFRCLSTLTVLIGPMMGKRTVCVVHTAPDHCNFNRLRWLPSFVRTQFIRAFASMLKRCDAVIALSAKHAGSLREAGFPITHVVPIPVLAGAGLEVAYRHHVWARCDPEVIGFVGELSRLKGADALPALMNALSPRYALCIVGDGPLSRSLIRAAHLLSSSTSARVTFVGMVAPSEMGAIYGKFDCIMILSRTESQSRVTLEAMLAGVIVLASPHTGLDDIVRDNVTGLFIDPGRPETVLEKLRYLGQFPLTAARIRACARAFALDLMSRSACDWIELVRTALDQQDLEAGI